MQTRVPRVSFLTRPFMPAAELAMLEDVFQVSKGGSFGGASTVPL